MDAKERFRKFEIWHRAGERVSPDQFRTEVTPWFIRYIVGDTAFYCSDFIDEILLRSKFDGIRYAQPDVGQKPGKA